MFDIVMPLFNKREFVEATIGSVLRQTRQDWRLFVVDDGSTDRGAEWVARCEDPRITVIRQQNQGVGPARNTGIGAGDSGWIAFLDADDVWNADHLAELDRLISEFPDAVLAGCRFLRFSGSAPYRGTSLGGEKRRLARYFAECARGREFFVTSSAAVRRSAIAQVGDFRPLPGNEDVELWARLALHGPVAVSAKRTVNYRVASGGLTDLRTSEGYKPLTREGLSSTIPLLTQRLTGIRDSATRRDISDYMNSRIGIRMVAAVLEGDFEYARQLIALYDRPPLGKARLAAVIIRLPDWLARPAVRAGHSVQRGLRSLSRRST